VFNGKGIQHTRHGTSLPNPPLNVNGAHKPPLTLRTLSMLQYIALIMDIKEWLKPKASKVPPPLKTKSL